MMSEDPSQTATYGAWVGKQEILTDITSPVSVARLEAILEQPRTEAGSGPQRLSPLGHWLQFTPTASMSALGKDGHPVLGGFMPPLDLPRRMWAGSKISYHSPIFTGQSLSRTTTIESITPKSGASGRLCFVVLKHEVFAEQTLALTEHQTIVYREAVPVDAANGTSQRPPRENVSTPTGWDWVSALQPNEVTLFRYSALTYNSHRIHYDMPYAVEVEGYPGLVVHGPLSATYIVDRFLRTHQEAAISTFEFSARAPIFVNELVHVVGRADGEGAEHLEVLDPTGNTAILARITYN